MFSSMADHFIRQIKIARHFYISQYDKIHDESIKSMKRNRFGMLVYLYLHCYATNDMSPFKTDKEKEELNFIKNAVTIEEVGNSEDKSYSINIDKNLIDASKHELDISKASVEYEKAHQMISIHNNNALISLLIRFESFLAGYFQWMVNKYPDKYLNEKTIKYSEIIKFDYENLKKELSIEAANSIMSQSIEEWLRTIRSHKIELSTLERYLTDFKEIYYRRNIIVHNNGKINRQYLFALKKDESTNPLGKKLNLDKKYILNAFNVSMIIVYGILYASLKCNSSDKPDYLKFLFNSGFEHMIGNDWAISHYIFYLLMMDESQDNIDIIISKINYWICCKNMGDFDSIKEEILESDFSAMDVQIRMAKEMLLENYEEAIYLLDEFIKMGFSPRYVETWPLFIQFRETEYFNQFKIKYAKALESQIVNTDNQNEDEPTENIFEDLVKNDCESNNDLKVEKVDD